MSDRGVRGSWIRESIYENFEIAYRAKHLLFSGRSPFQRIEVIESVEHGIMLLIDGVVMLSERDEFVYHEMIAHVPLFVHPAPRKVLIVGGGDGGTVREVARHDRVDRIVMVEIDEMVVEVCRRYLPFTSCMLDDPRVELHYEDGVGYVESTPERFDVAIIDSTDPVGPGAGLFAAGFYEKIAGLLTENGIMVTQAECAFLDADDQRLIFENQRPYFKRLHAYLYPTLSYPGALYTFGFASRNPRPLADFDAKRVAAAKFPTRYYNAAVHSAAFQLPNFMAQRHRGIIDPLF